MLNLTEHTVRWHRRLTFLNYFYALRILTWAFIWARETKTHEIRLSLHVWFFLIKNSRNLFRKFYLGLNRGAKKDRNTRGVTTNPP